jgi:hypothetical protein
MGNNTIRFEVDGGSSWLITVAEGDAVDLLTAMSDKSNTGKLFASLPYSDDSNLVPVTHHHHTLREDGLSPDRVRKALDGPSQHCTGHGCYNV